MQRSASMAGRSQPIYQTHASAVSLLAFSRVPISFPRHARLAQCAAADVTTSPVTLDDEAQVAQDPAAAPGDVSDYKGKQFRRSNQRKDNKKSTSANDDGSLIRERSRLLLKGEAVGLTLSSTPSDVAVGFKGVRPLQKALKVKNHTLLFFPSTRLVKPKAEQPEFEDQQQETSAPEREQKQHQQDQLRELDFALVAVPYFQKPEPEVTIRVGAKSRPDVIARTLTRALLRSSSVALRSAGPSAALVALLAAAQARRAIGAEQQLDLAFSLEYLRLPSSEAIQVAPDAEQSTATATEAASVAEASGGAGPPEAGKPDARTSVLQFSFYKRALPTPEVRVSDFAPTRSGPAMAQLLTSLISERREVDLLLDSRDALFAVQTLARVVRDSWLNHKASVGVFLTSLTPDPDSAAGSGSEGDDERSAAGEQPFTARLQLRRIPGAPNLVPTGGDGRSLLGPPVGTVKWDSPLGPLAGAMGREWYSAGIFSVWPQEGVCMARALRALWQAQQERAAAIEVETATTPTSGAAEATPTLANGSEAADADTLVDAGSSSPLFQIAVIPELQSEGIARESRNGGVRRNDSTATATTKTNTRSGASSSSPGRSVVLHLLEVSPLLAATLRSKDGRVVPISGGEQLHRLVKAVVLRNRMYANRRGGKVLALRPVLDDGGALAMRFQYIDAAIVTSIPPPPPPGQEKVQPHRVAPAAVPPPPPPVEADLELDGYATDDEYGLGAEAAVLVPQATAAAAAAAASAAAAAAASATSRAAAGGATGSGNKSPWVMFVSVNTSSMRLAMGIVAETCKAYDRRSPVWLKVKVRPDTITAAAMSVAMSQAQVQERANVELLVVPVLERKRDEQNRPFNALTWQLVKYGPGAEPGAAAAAAAAAAGQQATGPSQAAMAAAAAAAAKVQAQGDALMGGTRKLW